MLQKPVTWWHPQTALHAGSQLSGLFFIEKWKKFVFTCHKRRSRLGLRFRMRTYYHAIKRTRDQERLPSLRQSVRYHGDLREQMTEICVWWHACGSGEWGRGGGGGGGSLQACVWVNRPVDQVFTRIGTSDSIETNSSSFMVEMQDTAHIIQHATSRCPPAPIVITPQDAFIFSQRRPA